MKNKRFKKRKSYELTAIDRALFDELIQIEDEKEFVEGVFTFAFEQEDRKALTEYIRSNKDEATATDVSLVALDIHKARKVSKGLFYKIKDRLCRIYLKFI